MSKNQESEIRKKINAMAEENEYYNLQQNKNRARSITCGTAFGGTVEINMRGDHHSMWCNMTPVEALEFAEQLAAACGVQVALRPKNDFSAWRGWNLENTEYSHFKGSAPWQVPGADIHQSRLGGSGGTAGTPVEDEYPSKEKRIAEFKKQRDYALAELENLENNYQEQPNDARSVVPFPAEPSEQIKSEDNFNDREISVAGFPDEELFDKKVEFEVEKIYDKIEREKVIPEQQEAQSE